MKKVLKKIKEYRMLIVGIVGGVIIFGGGVYAATIGATNVSYSNASSGIYSNNVQDAIDKLYTKAKNAEAKCPTGYMCNAPKSYVYYQFGRPTSSSSKNFNDVISSSGSRSFIQLDGDEITICMYRNNTLECFKADSETSEKTHAKRVFGDSACSMSGSTLHCRDTDFDFYVYSGGAVYIYDLKASKYCQIISNSKIKCCNYNNSNGTWNCPTAEY